MLAVPRPAQLSEQGRFTGNAATGILREKLVFRVLCAVLAASLAAQAAASDLPDCSAEKLGKELCISGEMRKCIKEFSARKKSFHYEWYAVNKNGQAFSIDSPLYKKEAGYTPASCRPQ